MAAGDVLTFHSHTVHRALPNRTADRMRLSADFRYQPASHPVAPDSLLPHFARLTWEEIYAGWRDPSGRYHWREVLAAARGGGG
jgi:ectoine hydroxylase-related dioxygenase (phytanoyl-CoA dioxygenase family)